MREGESKTNDPAMTEFSRRRIRQYAFAVPAIASLFLAFWLQDQAGDVFLGIDKGICLIGLIAIVVSYAGFSLWNWRCPACNSYLGKGMNPKFCSKCGAALQG
ncbi:MAG: hypothetical protein KDH09_10015 [Chrysiogenetes bacterium]|nr:hypothetical protein [Chrysiogenetes bacterium]